MRAKAWRDERLTPGERRVVAELARDGASNAVIAHRAHYSVATVKFHLQGAMAVSGTTTRAGLALWWVRVGQWRQPALGGR